MILKYIKSKNIRISPLNFIVIFMNSPTIIGTFKPMPCPPVLTVRFNSCMLSLNYRRIIESQNGLGWRAPSKII